MIQPGFSIINILHDLFYIIIGALIYASGYVFFQLPYHLVPGGTSGAAALVFYSTGLPVQYTYWAFNAILLGVALKFLGFKFMFNTIIGVICLGGFMALFQLIAALEGVGLAVVFINNGSTGGTDIIAAVVNKFRDMSLGQVIVCTDFCIVSCGYFIFHDINLLIYSYITLIVTTVTLDYVVNNRRQSVQFFIISDKYEEISRTIASTGRGITVLTGIGWYTKEERKILVVLVRRRESPFVFRVIKEADPKALVSQSKVVGVFGNGFDRIKAK